MMKAGRQAQAAGQRQSWGSGEAAARTALGQATSAVLPVPVLVRAGKARARLAGRRSRSVSVRLLRSRASLHSCGGRQPATSGKPASRESGVFAGEGGWPGVRRRRRGREGTLAINAAEPRASPGRGSRLPLSDAVQLPSQHMSLASRGAVMVVVVIVVEEVVVVLAAEAALPRLRSGYESIRPSRPSCFACSLALKRFRF